jgi:parallel beta-helix repeat protein
MKKFILLFLTIGFFLFVGLAKADTYITGCQNLDVSGETYYLTQDIIDNGNLTCFYIPPFTTDVTLDCQGHLVDGIDYIDPVTEEEQKGVWNDRETGWITVRNCRFRDWVIGIRFEETDTTATNSSFISCHTGVISHAVNTYLTNLFFSDNNYGIYFFYAGGTLENITINNTSEYGILLDNSNYNTLRNITVRNTTSYMGIYLYYSSNNLLTNITVSNSGSFGIAFGTSSFSNTLTNSTIYNNRYGIELERNANNNQIYFNKIYNNTNASIYYYATTTPTQNNRIYNNLFNDTRYFYNVTAYIYPNYWNTTKQLGTRIIYSEYYPYIGGNYYTNATGNGYSDTCIPDTDGFCLPYTIAINNTDYLPLGKPPVNLPPKITIFSPLNQTYYQQEINFTFKAMDDISETFIVKAYLNGSLEYENLSYYNNTNITFYRNLTSGQYNFTVYANDTQLANSSTVIFTVIIPVKCPDDYCEDWVKSSCDITDGITLNYSRTCYDYPDYAINLTECENLKTIYYEYKTEPLATFDNCLIACINNFKNYNKCLKMCYEMFYVLKNKNYCLDNQTLAHNVTYITDNTTRNFVWTEFCNYGCNNETLECNPEPYKVNLFLLIGILGFFIFIGLLLRLFRVM